MSLMGLVRRHRWFIAAASTTLAFAVVSVSCPPSYGLTVFSDLFGLIIMSAVTALLAANATQRPRQERSFWALFALGFALWTSNQGAWCYYEIFLHRQIPDPFVFDIVLFFHAIPMLAAVAWRPDLAKKESKIHLSVLNFLMLLGWWIFLYAFLVFPHQYVNRNVDAYNQYYDGLYFLQNGVLIAVLLLASVTSSGGWRRVYLHLLGANVVYAIVSQLLDRAITSHVYYSGSFYDVPFLASIVWMAATALSARDWELKTEPFTLAQSWKRLVPRLAMITILSLPFFGGWALFMDRSGSGARAFRLITVMMAMLVLGGFVFLRQYIQDQKLMALLRESRLSYERQKQLQDQLVQKEKLASLGNLVAGAAHEIDHPLSAIMTYSEQLWSEQGLTAEQDSLIRKIVNQARRTRDLVADLLSFAQQAPGDKTNVDLRILLSRAIHMLESRRPPGKILVRLQIDKDLPAVTGNAKQLFQGFVEIIENAMDALEEIGGGSLEITAQHKGGEVLLQFSDTGPGLRDPQRVFDPFYTTKPIGKGTGLGLSAVYGMVQDHGGAITCENKDKGGALFSVRLPVGPAAKVAAVGV
jgi:signal transduction histidine kinase